MTARDGKVRARVRGRTESRERVHYEEQVYPEEWGIRECLRPRQLNVRKGGRYRRPRPEQ